ncbi:hypothetical protein [Variovorax sp. J22R115]|uniref:hypothetical protein n=1 Tax=Variovorax sp. J22R115 TaxID=3053509 RepID=UPI002574DDD4|nr:hypothetical protein [Variovorax sp. J22R115]MDM0049703.1 hypothetical protein [Variovorax sp. J22R115]
MESNSLSPPTDTGDARESTEGSSNAAWSDTREAGQPSQGGPTGGGADDASMRKAREDADTFGRKAADATQDSLQQVQAKADGVVQAGKAYAQDAVNAAGKKIDSMKGQAADLKQRSLQFAAHEPMKAVAYAAAGSAVLTAVLLSWMRGRR